MNKETKNDYEMEIDTECTNSGCDYKRRIKSIDFDSDVAYCIIHDARNHNRSTGHQIRYRANILGVIFDEIISNVGTNPEFYSY